MTTDHQENLSNTFTRFAQGFPLPVSPGTGNSNHADKLVEKVAMLLAYQRGIRYLEIQDGMLSTEQGFRLDALMPVVTDYMTHVLSPWFEWRFRSGLEDTLVRQYVESLGDDEPWSIQDVSEAVRDQVNRPLLYNVEDQAALANHRTRLREQPGIPFSVTLLMLDLAIEQMHSLSQAYQLGLLGESLDESLDLTPTIDMLANMEAHPRAEIPANIRNRFIQKQVDLSGGESDHPQSPASAQQK